MVANRGMGWTQVWKRGEKVSQTWKKRGKEMFLFRVARGPRGRYQKLVEDEVIKKQKRKEYERWKIFRIHERRRQGTVMDAAK
jgi:hypothetical protein